MPGAIPVALGVLVVVVMLSMIMGAGFVALGVIVTIRGVNRRHTYAVTTRTPAAREWAQGVTYTNWKGETKHRIIVPLSLWYGVTEWHTEPQWLLQALDVDKNEIRDFALSGFAAASAN